MPGEIVLVRHGETEWTLSGQHTSRTDIPLTDAGRREAQLLAARLAGRQFALVLTSPLQRAAETCRLAGMAHRAEVEPRAVEWDYGDYEGRTTPEIRQHHAGWTLWSDGAPGGEAPDRVGSRADQVIERLRSADGDAALFSHGHFLRVLAARWVGLGPGDGRRFKLGPASISVLGWEREQPVLSRWNDTVA